VLSPYSPPESNAQDKGEHVATTSQWSVTVSSFGICTHVNPQEDSETHQVVLVNARSKARLHEHRQLRENDVQPHDATLEILRRDLTQDAEARAWFPIIFANEERVVWKLDGVFLRIANGVRTVEGTHTPPACIPHLREYCAVLPSMRREAVETAAKTACIFEYPSSPYTGRSHNPNRNPDGGASVGVMTIGTSAPPILGVTSFDGDEVSFPVLSGAAITIANIPRIVKDDKDADFLLHFLALDDIPEGARYPGEQLTDAFFVPCTKPVSTKNLPLHLGDITTPGCSNSNYP